MESYLKTALVTLVIVGIAYRVPSLRNIVFGA